MILNIIFLILILIVLLVLITFIFSILNPIVSEKFKLFDNLLINFNISNPTQEGKKTTESVYKAFVVADDNIKFTSSTIENKSNLSCSIIKETYKSGWNQQYSCIGFGDCARICPQQAIIIDNSIAVVTKLCNGCGKCLEVCPQQLIKMAEKDVKISSLINSEDSEKSTEIHSQKFDESVKWIENRKFKIWTHLYSFLNIAD